jgi:hypothetical protein
VHASEAVLDGHAVSANAELVRAMSTWAHLQASAASVEAPPTPFEQDARIIYDLLFKTSSSASVMLVPVSINVTVGDDPQPIVVRHRPAVASKIVSLTQDEATTLWNAVELLSRCEERREGRLTRLWVGVVGFAPSYCGSGGSSGTTTAIQSIHLANSDRTRAHAMVLFGSGGHEPILEKIDGVWKVTGSAGAWEY